MSAFRVSKRSKLFLGSIALGCAVVTAPLVVAAGQFLDKNEIVTAISLLFISAGVLVLMAICITLAFRK